MYRFSFFRGKRHGVGINYSDQELDMFSVAKMSLDEGC